MIIPKTFCIGGGKTIKIEIVDILEKDGIIKFGEWNDASSTITIAKKVKIGEDVYKQSKEDMFRTFLHELFHVFQFYCGADYSESESQVYSNFLFEYLNSYEI